MSLRVLNQSSRMFRVRFSLRAFLLLLFIASLIGSNLFTAWQLGKVREENAQMRKELGYLVVSDPTKVNVVAVPTYEDMLWRWRIYVPQGHSLWICGSTRDVPQIGVTDSYSSATLTEGEYLLTAAIRPDRHGKWQLTVARQGGSASFGFGGDDGTWIDEGLGWESMQAGTGTTEVLDPDQLPGVLLRVRAMVKTATGSMSSPSPTTKGVLVWISKR
ncbi:MAG TPA: hypothetical protein VHC22_09920 [Pirellulales bacterium]|nr:hypothetical protein [Pirellulales bacterium]